MRWHVRDILGSSVAAIGTHAALSWLHVCFRVVIVRRRAIHVHIGTWMDILRHVILLRAAVSSLAWSVEIRISLTIIRRRVMRDHLLTIKAFQGSLRGST